MNLPTPLNLPITTTRTWVSYGRQGEYSCKLRKGEGSKFRNVHKNHISRSGCSFEQAIQPRYLLSFPYDLEFVKRSHYLVDSNYQCSRSLGGMSSAPIGCLLTTVSEQGGVAAELRAGTLDVSSVAGVRSETLDDVRCWSLLVVEVVGVLGLHKGMGISGEPTSSDEGSSKDRSAEVVEFTLIVQGSQRVSGELVERWSKVSTCSCSFQFRQTYVVSSNSVVGNSSKAGNLQSRFACVTSKFVVVGEIVRDLL